MKFKALYLVAMLIIPLLLSGLLQIVFMPAALAASPVAVLKSARNAAVYQDQHIGTLEDDFKAFRNALAGANVRFDEIGDADVEGGQAKLSAFKLIIVPLLVDLPQAEVAALGEFQKNGGKLLISDGAGTPGPGAQALAAMAGVASLKQNTLKDIQKLVWPRTVMPFSCDFAIASVVAHLTLAPGATAIATWQDAKAEDQTVDVSQTQNQTQIPTQPKVDQACAIARQGNGLFLGWSPGMQGEISSNAQLLAQALDELSPGITQAAAVQISFADFTSISQELDYLAKRTDESIKTAKQAEFSVPLKTIQGFYDSALDHVKKFQTAYSERRFLDADEQVQKARMDFCMAFAQSMPIRPVEARCIWLDRGTIVAAHNPQGMSQLFDKIKQAGVNVVYFETNNAGFAMFPSKVGTQNPETLGWDPLGSALSEARKRGIEFHLWMWTFNVGNNKHNPIIGKEADYPGPVLSSHDFAWALASQSGSFVPPRQFEYWLDPSNPDCRQYIKNFALEMVTKYKVDGLQLDYIRYPFNGKGSEMGFNWLGRQKFERETGMSLDRLDDDTRQLWVAWKVAQVSSFVKDISETLRAASPGLRMSAAVYALPYRWRINAIQQEWETWVANGWVDTLNPMTYVDSPKELAEKAAFVRESTADKALSYPGLSIRQLDTAGLIEQMDSARVVGTLGTTMFAMAHLDDKKVNVLKVGPYRRAAAVTPQAEPIKASRLLVDDFASMVNRYLQDPKKRIMSDTASTNDVVNQIDSVQKSVHALNSKATSAELESVLKDVTALHNTCKEWLRLEAFIQRGFRAQYIANYLSQVEAILSYAATHAKVQGQGSTLAGQLPATSNR
ncbi:MAG: family 10 glycosylhydrolase [Cyanobacteria bacterium REEB67]|nr:family 10 glycosylhydrolase [Cyanobacteria bacterium REEB67]